MSDAQSQYQAKLLTAVEAADSIEGRTNLILAMGVAMPPAFMQALADRVRGGSGLSRLKLFYMHVNAAAAETILSEDLMHVLELHSLFMSGFERKFDAEGHKKRQNWIQFVPCMFHQAGRLLSEQIEPDCFVATVSPMDRSGHFSLGTIADYGATLIRRAKRVIVEVNQHMPRSFGENLLHISQVSGIVEHNTPLMEVPDAHPTEEDRKIAQLISEEIPDGATIQMGVGGVPASVVEALSDHNDLGLHSELLSPP